MGAPFVVFGNELGFPCTGFGLRAKAPADFRETLFWANLAIWLKVLPIQYLAV